ncbi:hypothetical protein BOX37_20430 [Nocardia mangyaensis]|uniref:Uncharacterized protein n=2 Tax=Nocardia mangyaensis TaxID=2213200 RepID=A0A1J0VV68_9NOCA|nr:hypothetical protein BOX37_20430 [Nocardia mangyaensis]
MEFTPKPPGSALTVRTIQFLVIIVSEVITNSSLTLDQLAVRLGLSRNDFEAKRAGVQVWRVAEVLNLAAIHGALASDWLAIAESIAALEPGTEVWFIPAATPGSARVGTVVEVNGDTGAVKLVEQSGRIHWTKPQDVLEPVVDELSVEYAAVAEEEKSRLEREVRALGDELTGIPVKLTGGVTGVIVDSDEHGLVIAVSDEERLAHRAAVVGGRACCRCGRAWAIGESSKPAGFTLDGDQLFRCSRVCVEVAR